MSRLRKQKLVSAMNGIIASRLKDGERLTTGQIRDLTKHEAPDLVHAEAESLVDGALSSMANSLLKRASKQEKEEIRVNIFGNREKGLTIPRSIALPSPENGREMIWVSTVEATLSEARLYLSHLTSGIKADQRKARQIKKFIDRVTELANSDDEDTPINELLQGLRKGGAA